MHRVPSLFMLLSLFKSIYFSIHNFYYSSHQFINCHNLDSMWMRWRTRQNGFDNSFR